MIGERGYLELVRTILNRGVTCDNRTGVPTRSLFGAQLRFDLRDGSLPLLTTRRLSFDAILRELLWFVSGSTDQSALERQGVNIWRANSSPEFLANVSSRYRPYRDLGPIYGHQWRHYGAPYDLSDTSYDGQGVDQLANVVSQLRHDPDSRRIIITAWNPLQLSEVSFFFKKNTNTMKKK